jgi:hypothetical protein
LCVSLKKQMTATITLSRPRWVVEISILISYAQV